MPETPPPATSSPTASPDDQDGNARERTGTQTGSHGNANASLPASHVDQTKDSRTPADAPQPAPQPAQEATPQAAAQDQGDILTASPAAPRHIETFRPVVQTARGGNGRFEPITPKDPRLGEKAQPSALLNSPPKTSEPNDLQPRERGIKGLDVIPKDWPKLPGNVSLGVELAWVQANRLDVVKELPSGVVKVDLSKACAPAPSKSAIGWLETSIRSYAKFIEVASKSAGTASDEQEFIRKERMAIAEIDALLAEMEEAEG